MKLFGIKFKKEIRFFMLIFSHIFAAILPILIFLLYMFAKKKQRIKKNIAAFWKRQNQESLFSTNINKLQSIPEPYNFIAKIDSLRTTIQTVSLSIELGLFHFLKRNPGVTKEEIKKYLDFSERTINALIEVLLASDVIKIFQNGYSLTARAELYLLEESPFFQPLPPASLAKRFIKVAKSGIVKGAVNKWNKGKSSNSIRWSLKQHEYSFPLGFAISDSEAIKGKNVLDVAGGTGAVCIALAQKNSTLNLKMIELPQSVGIAKKMIAQYKLSDRIECIGMDMFNSDWPKDNDTIMFTNIFHDWDNKHCTILADNAFTSLNPGGTILINEALLYEDKPGPLWTAHWSMTMALTMKGKQFRFNELKSILESAGFKNIKQQPLLGYYSTISGIKI